MERQASTPLEQEFVGDIVATTIYACVGAVIRLSTAKRLAVYVLAVASPLRAPCPVVTTAAPR